MLLESLKLARLVSGLTLADAELAACFHQRAVFNSEKVSTAPMKPYHRSSTALIPQIQQKLRNGFKNHQGSPFREWSWDCHITNR